MKYIIRKSKIEDCADIAHIVTTSWNETYKGIVNDEFLNNMINTESARTERAISSFDDKSNHQFVLEVNNKIVGFVKVCENEEENCGEIQALYIINGYKGNGYGRKLVEVGIKEIKKMGYKKFIIGCLEGNSTNNFYKHIGGKYLKQRIFNLPNQELNENVYRYDINE